MGRAYLRAQFFRPSILGCHPDRDLIFATYGQERLSDDFGRKVRNLIADPIHGAIFPECSLSEDSTAAHRFNTAQAPILGLVATDLSRVEVPTCWSLTTLSRMTLRRIASQLARDSTNGIHR